ncbi:hypothetical protein C8P67_104355 [Flavobacterium aquicola]|uniref:Activator of Hsp90 ATPase-like protein n=1 Tax=Flavobacterium aquicola TaxID=1682742 RepID=A0A3E0EPQ1_9FLAO|nr:hypothetical protein C8P67_104355 [Flavobacterium aquicola]
MAVNISKIKINTAKQKVWDTLTKPEFVKLWQFGSKLQTTWEVDSPIKFINEWEGKIFEQLWNRFRIYANRQIAIFTIRTKT